MASVRILLSQRFISSLIPLYVATQRTRSPQSLGSSIYTPSTRYILNLTKQYTILFEIAWGKHLVSDWTPNRQTILPLVITQRNSFEYKRHVLYRDIMKTY